MKKSGNKKETTEQTLTPKEKLKVMLELHDDETCNKAIKVLQQADRKHYRDKLEAIVHATRGGGKPTTMEEVYEKVNLDQGLSEYLNALEPVEYMLLLVSLFNQAFLSGNPFLKND